MIVTISQPRYLPWLGYFHRIAVSDLFIYLDTVQYTPRDWENRNRVKTSQGPTWLTVPVNARYRALIPEVLIDNEQPWQEKHWRTLASCYGAAPHWDRYSPLLRELYRERNWHSLTDLNLELTDALCRSLGLPRDRFVKASSIAASGRSSELILNLCKAVGATAYLSGSQGRNYLDEAAFADCGIRLLYQDYSHPQYRQLYGDFLPNMAAVDLLFNHGPESSNILMTGQDPV